MKKIILLTVGFMLTALIFGPCYSFAGKVLTENISFYTVSLVCGADSTIGCGSRIKPLFIEAQKERQIKESWVNRQGTVIAFIWADGKPDSRLVKKLFNHFDIEGSLITDKKQISELIAGMNGKEQWYQGMAVDSLSLHEAETIASKTTKIILDGGLMTEEEASAIRPEIEAYFKKELIKVRTFEELCRDEKTKWLNDSYQIYANHIGTDRAEKVKAYYSDYWSKKEQEKKECKKACGSPNKKSCCKKK